MKQSGKVLDRQRGESPTFRQVDRHVLVIFNRIVGMENVALELCVYDDGQLSAACKTQREIDRR